MKHDGPKKGQEKEKEVEQEQVQQQDERQRKEETCKNLKVKDIDHVKTGERKRKVGMCKREFKTQLNCLVMKKEQSYD